MRRGAAWPKEDDMDYRNKIHEVVFERLPAYQEAAKAIHAHPETSNHEYFAQETLTKLLQADGFTIVKDVAGHPTGFTASYRAKKAGPVIVFLAEYDALTGIGHACGHNLFGATSALSAVALKSVIDETGGEVRVYGTPGEEGGENGSAKGSFVREGFLKDVDAALCAHSGKDIYTLTPLTLACAPVDIVFHGKASHAASAPEKGINALDALLQVYNSINALRQHVTSDVRIHGIITDGGKAPNVVPDYAAAKFYLRAAKASTLDVVYKRVEDIVKGAALATGATGSMKPSQNRVDNTVVTPSFDSLYAEELLALGFEAQPADTKAVGSSDVGNVSHVVPTIQPHLRISPVPIAAHSEEFKKAAISEEGLNSIAIGAEVLANTALRLIEEPQLLAAIKAEHAEKLKAEALP